MVSFTSWSLYPRREWSQEGYLLKKGWVSPEASLCTSKITCLLRGSHQHSHILQYIAWTKAAELCHVIQITGHMLSVTIIIERFYLISRWSRDIFPCLEASYHEYLKCNLNTFSSKLDRIIRFLILSLTVGLVVRRRLIFSCVCVPESRLLLIIQKSHICVTVLATFIFIGVHKC